VRLLPAYRRDVFGKLQLRPSKTLAIRSDIHSLRLANRNDLWYSGGGAFQVAPARLAMARLLAEHPRIDGVWTGNDLMAFGALEALADSGRSAKVVGINGLPGAIERIEQGTMLASVDFSAFNIAAIAARAALRHLAGEAVPKQIMIPAVLIDRTNHRAWQVPFAARPLMAWEDVVGGCSVARK
jgi:ribose transport system substrate-binding protein